MTIEVHIATVLLHLTASVSNPFLHVHHGSITLEDIAFTITQVRAENHRGATTPLMIRPVENVRGLDLTWTTRRTRDGASITREMSALSLPSSVKNNFRHQTG